MSLHEQLISRNHQNLAEVIQVFLELNDSYQGQFCIYMDSQVWELFDTRVAKTIFKHQFKHFNQFRQDMLRLKHDIINVGCVNWSIGRGRKPKPSQVWSIKSLINIYGFEDKYFFSNPFLKEYIIYGIVKTKENYSDNY